MHVPHGQDGGRSGSGSDREHAPEVSAATVAGSAVATGTSEPMGSAQNPRPEQPAEPDRFAFDEASEREIAVVLKLIPPSRKASAVLPLLYVVQEQMGRQTGSAWVPRVAMDVVAHRLGMPPIRVYEVATFYLMFNTNPIGRYHLQVCGTTPCWLRGSDDITRACRDETGIKSWKETSADGMFTMTEVECLGACVNAPILQVDNDYYEDLDYDRTRALAAGAAPGRAAAGRIDDRAHDLGARGRPDHTDIHTDNGGVSECSPTLIEFSPTSTASTTRSWTALGRAATGTRRPRSLPAAVMRSSTR